MARNFPSPTKKQPVSKPGMDEFIDQAAVVSRERNMDLELDAKASEQIGFKVSPGEKRALQSMADEQNRSVSYILRTLIREKIGAPPPPARGR